MTDIINFCNELKKVINYKNIILVEAEDDKKCIEDELEINGYGTKVIQIPKTNYYIGMSNDLISPRRLKNIKIIPLEKKPLETSTIFNKDLKCSKMDNIIILTTGMRVDIAVLNKLMAPIDEILIYDLKGYKRIKTHNINNYEEIRNRLIYMKKLGVLKSFTLYHRRNNLVKYTAKSTNFKEYVYKLESYEGYILISENEELDKKEIFKLYGVDSIEELQNKIKKEI